MTGLVRNIIIVGGGTAGWLAACMIAARIDRSSATPLAVTLVESPDVPTIGVGEGTWPTMRRTLEGIGLSEVDFLLACDGAFKQGSRFDGWATGAADDQYYHPFTAPLDADPRALVDMWRDDPMAASFADSLGAQPGVCARDLAPRQSSMPDYAGALNYAYHLDAGKLAALLMRHATGLLGVRHVRDHVTRVEAGPDGDLTGVATREHGVVQGDLFVDCTGRAALLIGGHYGVPMVDHGHVLFNDRALAVQAVVDAGSPIASQTNATAHRAGWIWDIGLPTRRGIGCVYSSAHMDDDGAAAVLRDYVAANGPNVDADRLTPRRLTFGCGHRARFWERNCIAIGLSAGFLEPLEASAIVLIELSLNALLDGFPATGDLMLPRATRFNALFTYRWSRIVEFLKLHYVLSRRTEPYWRAHREGSSVPPRLTELLDMWRFQPPSRSDFDAVDEVFPAASYQYVLYGMGYTPPARGPMRHDRPERTHALTAKMHERGRMLTASLQTNRAYLDALRREHGLAGNAVA